MMVGEPRREFRVRTVAAGVTLRHHPHHPSRSILADSYRATVLEPQPSAQDPLASRSNYPSPFSDRYDSPYPDSPFNDSMNERLASKSLPLPSKQPMVFPVQGRQYSSMDQAYNKPPGGPPSAYSSGMGSRSSCLLSEWDSHSITGADSAMV